MLDLGPLFNLCANDYLYLTAIVPSQLHCLLSVSLANYIMNWLCPERFLAQCLVAWFFPFVDVMLIAVF